MKNLIIIAILVASLFAIYKAVSISNVGKGITDDQAQLIMFHGDGCPHCKIVLDFIKADKVDEKIKISYHEVYYNKTNQNLLAETAKKCPEIDTSQGIGVPLAYDKANNKCMIGDTPIIDWLKSQMLK